MQNVTELSIGIRRIDFATYTKERGGITFRRFVIFQTSEEVATDRLLVSDEAVRVLDRRE
jgi:hypothetical protein